MTETITTFCDYCNPDCRRNSDGRGYVDYPKEFAIEEFGWIETEEQRIQCQACQEEKERE